ncbi:hypothetical protein CR513_07425, partial [Mucuna pruriens]
MRLRVKEDPRGSATQVDHPQGPRRRLRRPHLYYVSSCLEGNDRITLSQGPFSEAKLVTLPVSVAHCQIRHVQCLPIQSINHHIGFTRVVTKIKLKILEVHFLFFPYPSNWSLCYGFTSQFVQLKHDLHDSTFFELAISVKKASVIMANSSSNEVNIYSPKSKCMMKEKVRLEELLAKLRRGLKAVRDDKASVHTMVDALKKKKSASSIHEGIGSRTGSPKTLKAHATTRGGETDKRRGMKKNHILTERGKRGFIRNPVENKEGGTLIHLIEKKWWSSRELQWTLSNVVFPPL